MHNRHSHTHTHASMHRHSFLLFAIIKANAHHMYRNNWVRCGQESLGDCRRMNRVGFECEIVRSLRETQPQRKHLCIDLGSKATAVAVLPKSYGNKVFLGEMQGP